MKKINKFTAGLVLIFGLAFSFGSYAHASSTPDVDFIDVSHHNNEDGLPLAFYQTIKAGGIGGVVVKVSEGSYYVDPAASVNIANAKQAGLIVNAYHFARFTSKPSAKTEADWFDKKLQLVGFDKKKDGYVVVDVEADTLSSNPAALTEYTNTFITEMKNLGYSRMDLYTGSSFYNNRLKPQSLNVSKPWLASYPGNPVKNQPTAKFSNGKGAWQWSQNYRFIGMANYGYFDVSEDYAGKYTVKTAATQKVTKSVGTIQSVSLVNYMKSKHMDASYSNRSKLSKSYGITNYQGTSAQNLALLSKLKSGVKPAKTNTSNSKLTSQPIVKKLTTKTYTVKKGDTLSGIAQKYQLTVSEVKIINKLKSNIIFPKQKLQIE
ncbi:GH25 family lysozyme [Heyndrickxia acidicola]|uniref:GH25 family lysozyme n=1 Tax=Heyndrickxia acidicola TaxID=209389 RepID=A0ABU6MFW4_9BACI|nr:GH25 family lysozyme [Heyndrickxia acidicola]MED1201930.1 GH25 family lysozyme [Heyndrickxia acidicola]